MVRVAGFCAATSSRLPRPALFSAPGEGISNHFTAPLSGARPRETSAVVCFSKTSEATGMAPPGGSRLSASVLCLSRKEACNSGPEFRFFAERKTTRKRPGSMVTKGKVHSALANFSFQPAKFTATGERLSSSTHGCVVPSASRSVVAFCTCTSLRTTGEAVAGFHCGPRSRTGSSFRRSGFCVLRIHSEALSACVTSRSSRSPSRERMVRMEYTGRVFERS